jgi:hypothetical protein
MTASMVLHSDLRESGHREQRLKKVTFPAEKVFRHRDRGVRVGRFKER